MTGDRLREAPETVIEDLDHDGRGVGRIADKVVFVDGALPGERVRVRITKQGRHYDQARLEEVLASSPDRVTPACHVFGTCGGCSLQHLDPAAQVSAKEGWLRGNLEHTARTLPERWLEPLDGPHWGYRAKARLSIRHVPRKGVLVGFRERASSFVTQMERCPVLEPRLDALIAPLKELVAGLSRSDRVPQAEVAASERDTAVVLRHLTELTGSDRDRLRAFQAAHGVVAEAQSKGPETAAPVDPGRPADLYYTLPDYGLRLDFRATDFIQVNLGLNRLLVARAMELLEPAPGDGILDLFCGLGNFSLAAARRGASVDGLEGERSLVERAAANAAGNGLAEVARFSAVDLAATPLGEVPAARVARKILLDPPRSGAIEVVKQLAELRPERIVYVSCNPATLARDAAVLVSGRFRLESAGIANMFPHTAHVETIARFLRAD